MLVKLTHVANGTVSSVSVWPLFHIKFNSNLNSMENLFQHNSIFRYKMAKKFCACHNNTAVMPCAKCHDDYFITIKITAEWNLNYDGKIVSEKSPRAVNTMTLRQNDCCFADDILIFQMACLIVFWSKLHYNVFPGMLLIICQHLFR